MKKKDRFLQGWRACEQHLQQKLRQELNRKIKELVLGYELSFSDDAALKYYREEGTEDEDTPYVDGYEP